MSKPQKTKVKKDPPEGSLIPVVSDQPKLSPSRIAALERSRKQIAEGEVISNKESNRLADEWLKS